MTRPTPPPTRPDRGFDAFEHARQVRERSALEYRPGQPWPGAEPVERRGEPRYRGRHPEASRPRP